MNHLAAIAVTGDGAHASRLSRTITLAFSERRVPVRFVNAVEVIERIRCCLRGWEIQPANHVSEPPVVVRRRRDGYRVDSIWLDEPMSGLTDVAAACCAVIDVLECLLDADRSLLCLHCAAVETGGRLVVLTGPSRVGKSTLAARLSSEDLVVFCDDMLPLDHACHGIAVGVGPRLRLPLPDAASPGFRAHVARHLGPADDRYGFVNAPTVADFGRRAPVGAIVLLHRRPAGPAAFRPAQPAEALGLLIRQNIAADREPEKILDRLHGLAAGVPCLRLEYSDVEDATALLTRAFAHWPPRDLQLLPARPEVVPPPPLDEAPPPDPARRYRRRGDVAVRRVGGELFLTQAEERRILRLNQIGAAVWTLLARAATPRAIARDLAIAFPDVDREAIEADVLRLVGTMIAFGLVRPERGRQGQ